MFNEEMGNYLKGITHGRINGHRVRDSSHTLTRVVTDQSEGDNLHCFSNLHSMVLNRRHAVIAVLTDMVRFKEPKTHSLLPSN